MSIQTEIFSVRQRNPLTNTVQEIQSGQLFAIATERILEQCEYFSDPSPSQLGIELENTIIEKGGKSTIHQVETNF
jgi:hypothetical protein